MEDLSVIINKSEQDSPVSVLEPFFEDTSPCSSPDATFKPGKSLNPIQQNSFSHDQKMSYSRNSCSKTTSSATPCQFRRAISCKASKASFRSYHYQNYHPIKECYNQRAGIHKKSPGIIRVELLQTCSKLALLNSNAQLSHIHQNKVTHNFTDTHTIRNPNAIRSYKRGLTGYLPSLPQILPSRNGK